MPGLALSSDPHPPLQRLPASWCYISKGSHSGCDSQEEWLKERSVRAGYLSQRPPDALGAERVGLGHPHPDPLGGCWHSTDLPFQSCRLVEPEVLKCLLC